jgi:SOS-response transcriptional repressor LexA
MQAMRWEHADVVRVSGETSSVVSQWLGHGSKEIKSMGSVSAAVLLGRASGFDPIWIATGKGPKIDPHARHVVREGDAVTYAAQRRVPVIEWHAIPQPGSRTLSAAARDVPALSSQPGPRAFALEVDGDAMTSANAALSFPRGTIIIVDPDRPCAPGDFVLGRVAGGPAFRQLARDGGRWFLTPLNPAYPAAETEAPNDSNIIGRIVEFHWQGLI